MYLKYRLLLKLVKQLLNAIVADIYIQTNNLQSKSPNDHYAEQYSNTLFVYESGTQYGTPRKRNNVI